MSRTQARRLAKLEALRKPGGRPRMVVRWVDITGEGNANGEADIDENDPNTILVIWESVGPPAKASPGGRPRMVVRWVDITGEGNANGEADIDENDPNTILVIWESVGPPAKASLGPTG